MNIKKKKKGFRDLCIVYDIGISGNLIGLWWPEWILNYVVWNKGKYSLNKKLENTHQYKTLKGKPSLYGCIRHLRDICKTDMLHISSPWSHVNFTFYFFTELADLNTGI